MNTFLTYQLQSAILIGISWVIYRLLLRNQNRFNLNRAFLLLSLSLSVIFPLLASRIDIIRPELIAIQLPVFSMDAYADGTPASPGYWNYFWTLYLSGLILFAAYHFYRLFMALRIIVRSQKSSEYPAYALHNSQTKGAFAFYNRLVWNESILSAEDRRVIFTHELVHIRQRHTLDVFLGEWISVLQWFNPFVYLLRKELKEVHEFLADKGSLQNEHYPGLYLNTILNRALHINAPYMFNSFGNVSLKRRLIMMNSANRKSVKLRYALAIVLFAFVSVVLTTPSSVQAISSGSSGFTILDPYSYYEAAPQEETSKVVKQMPEYPGGQEAMIQFMVENIKFPAAARKEGISGTVYVTFVVDNSGIVKDVKVLRGIGGGCDEEALRVVNAMPHWKPGINKEGKAVNVQMNLPVKFKLEDKPTEKAK